MQIWNHLTITSEWDSYKLKPVMPVSEVSSLIDSDGFLLPSNNHINNKAVLKDIEKEYRAQILKALESGIDLTHIDSHMFTPFSNKGILKIYKALGSEFKLPVLLTKELPVSTLIEKDAIIVDHLLYAEPEDFRKDMHSFYSEVLKSINPGLNCILIHTAYNNEEMQHITDNQPDYGSAWRQADFDFFTSDKCFQLIKDNNIILITWRRIRDMLVRKEFTSQN